MKKNQKWVIGIDEVGRGPLAGPVVVCGVLYPAHLYKKTLWKGVTDSKKMTARAREEWYEKRDAFIAEGGKYAIALAAAKEIDTKGIAVCIKKNIASILKELEVKPSETLVLLDGSLRAPEEFVHQKTIIQGDNSEKVIALASVYAKVYRDRYMEIKHKKYPLYNWDKNKGYGTISHRKCIKEYGITPLHRKSFLTRILNKE